MLLKNRNMRLRGCYRSGCPLLTLVLACWLSGCGGGGAVYPVATQTRLLQAGDQWVYAVSESADGQNSHAHLTVTLKTAMLNGSPVLEEDSTQDTLDGPITTSRLLIQDPVTRMVSAVGNRQIADPQTDPNVPTTFILGSWAVGTAFTTDTDTVQVTAVERVGTSKGAFNAYKATLQSRIRVGNESDGATRWYAPQIGTYVRAEYNSFCTVCGVKSYKSVYVLESTNVPVQ